MASLDLYEHILEKLPPPSNEQQQRYSTASPFPHIVLDDFLPPAIAEEILKHYPTPDFSGFQKPDHKQHQVGKLGRVQDQHFRGIHPWLRNTLLYFNSMPFLLFLQELTGISDLLPDPGFKGGAFHQVLPGGKLDIHMDFNIDENFQLKRRLNLLLYLNKDWKDEYEGHLELWSKRTSSCEQKISPIFNRCVIFDTSMNSLHGHPKPLRCPENMTRKSLAFYYYTSVPDEIIETEAHSTIWHETT